MSFAIDLTKITKKYKNGLGVVVKKITMEAFKRVILRTPVDTGRARANWSVSPGTMGTTYELESFDKAGNKTVSTATRTVNGWDCHGSIFLSNNVPYILNLEYGGSNQAPSGMVRLTVDEMAEWEKRVQIDG